MRRTLGALIAVGALVVAAPAAEAATKNVKVGPNAKLSSDKHTVSVATKVVCDNNAKNVVQAKVKQGDVVGKGTKTVQCEKGTTKSVTVDVANTGATFGAGDAQACATAAKKGSGKTPDATCRTVKVAT